jgi:hypothetical protein
MSGNQPASGKPTVYSRVEAPLLFDHNRQEGRNEHFPSPNFSNSPLAFINAQNGNSGNGNGYFVLLSE